MDKREQPVEPDEDAYEPPQAEELDTEVTAAVTASGAQTMT